MKRLWLIVLVTAGCTAPTLKPSTNPSSVRSVEVDPAKDYGRQMIAYLDAFDDVARKSQTMSDADMEQYVKSKKVPEAILQRMKLGVQEEEKAIKATDDLIPPTQFRKFHVQVIKSMKERQAMLRDLESAIEKGDRSKIKKVLDGEDAHAIKRRDEMNKIMGGLTAERYLGVK